MGDIFDGNIFTNSDASRIIAADNMTSLVSGCEWVLDSATTVKVPKGEIFVSNPITGTYRFQPVAEQTGIPHAVGVPVSRLQISSDGIASMVPFTGHLTEVEKQDIVQIGVATHLDLVNIDEEFVTISAVFGISRGANQEMFATGIVRESGLELVLNADLTFGSKAGTFRDPLADSFWSNPSDPYLVSAPAVTAYGVDANTTMFRQWFGNAGEENPKISGLVTTVDPSVYDDPDIAPTDGAPGGSLIALEAQNVSIHIAKSKTGLRCGQQYGRDKPPPFNLVDAKVSALNQTRENGAFVQGTRLAGIISLRQGATVLTDTAWAHYTQPTSDLVTTR